MGNSCCSERKRDRPRFTGWKRRGWLHRVDLQKHIIDGQVLRYAYGSVALGAQDKWGSWKREVSASADPRWHHACLLIEMQILPPEESEVEEDGLVADSPESPEESPSASPQEPDFAPNMNPALLAVGVILLLLAVWGCAIAFIIYPLFLDPDAGEWEWGCAGNTAGFGNQRCFFATGSGPCRAIVAICQVPIGVFTMSSQLGLSFGLISPFTTVGVAALAAGVAPICGGFVGMGAISVVGWKCPFALVWNRRHTQILPVCLPENEGDDLERLYGPVGDPPGILSGEAQERPTILYRVDYGPESIPYFSVLPWASLSRVHVVGGWRTPVLDRFMREIPAPKGAYSVWMYNCQDYVLDGMAMLHSDDRFKAKARCDFTPKRRAGYCCDCKAHYWIRDDDEEWKVRILGEMEAAHGGGPVQEQVETVEDVTPTEADPRLTTPLLTQLQPNPHGGAQKRCNRRESNPGLLLGRQEF
eukprot:Hpha_TRINITY_DN15131_c4_g3::TRINITY_DN15131_c4_g3_i1::g.128177::m.128177